jgi:hypothetical protein
LPEARSDRERCLHRLERRHAIWFALRVVALVVPSVLDTLVTTTPLTSTAVVDGNETDDLTLDGHAHDLAREGVDHLALGVLDEGDLEAGELVQRLQVDAVGAM